jgi:hypothetical protein
MALEAMDRWLEASTRQLALACPYRYLAPMVMARFLSSRG